jgi:hypothetical protein
MPSRDAAVSLAAGEPARQFSNPGLEALDGSIADLTSHSDDL